MVFRQDFLDFSKIHNRKSKNDIRQPDRNDDANRHRQKDMTFGVTTRFRHGLVVRRVLFQSEMGAIFVIVADVF